MSFAFSRGNNIIDCNGQVTNSSITNSTIDMNGGAITNHGTPANPTDVVNKEYVDSIVSTSIPNSTVTLTGISYVTLLTMQSGSALLLIKNLVANGPAATFLISKSEPSRQPSISRFTSSDGLTTNEKLFIRWNPNTGVELKKTGVNYDGEYIAKYIAI